MANNGQRVGQGHFCKMMPMAFVLISTLVLLFASASLPPKDTSDTPMSVAPATESAPSTRASLVKDAFAEALQAGNVTLEERDLALALALITNNINFLALEEVPDELESKKSKRKPKESNPKKNQNTETGKRRRMVKPKKP